MALIQIFSRPIDPANQYKMRINQNKWTAKKKEKKNIISDSARHQF
jgi:hypothetical protein